MSTSTTKVDLSMSSTQSTSAQGSDELGKTEFLELLCAQMANQDPTKPVDSTTFVAELAQFSALEQQQNTNDTLTQMLELQQSSAGNNAVAMVGKDALYNSNEMSLGTKGGTISVDATLAADAGSVTMIVADADGNLIRQQDFGPTQAGKQTFVWDGMNQNGAEQEPGTYSITVSATDVSGTAVGASQQSRGRITGVTFDNGTSQLLIGTTVIPISDVQSIQESSSNSK
jgi:flagellar basal-body rod modification protein FlgD